MFEFLREHYPCINFSLPTQESLENELDGVTSPRRLSERSLAESVLNPVIAKAVADFEKYKPDFQNSSPTAQHQESKERWENEARYRRTSGGTNPPDWPKRRAVVYDRDQGRCRRCGRELELIRCHIHHVKRRSEGGDHSLDNLVTLCRDCHTLMAGHETLRSIRPYVISGTGKIHVPGCYSARGGSRVWGALPRLCAEGYGTCARCKPWTWHESALSKWTPRIRKELYSLIEQTYPRVTLHALLTAQGPGATPRNHQEDFTHMH
jgi:5-methylcytosine-specific restriction endonuclease McrA